MLSLSHIYVSQSVIGRYSDYLALGSIIPDLATTAPDLASRQKIHDSPAEFYDFIKANYPDLLDLALGVCLHSSIDRGADFYSDNHDTGYAIIKGKLISAEVAAMLNRPDDQVSLVLSHNFIEAGVDCHLLKTYPYLLTQLQQATGSPNLDTITLPLSRFLDCSEDNILQNLKTFLDYVGPKTFLTTDSMINQGVLPLIKLLLKQDVDPQTASKILQHAIEITSPDFQSFFDSTVSNMKTDFSSLIRRSP